MCRSMWTTTGARATAGLITFCPRITSCGLRMRVNNTEAPIEEVAKADVWKMKPGGIIEGLRDASLEVSAETDMMILSGRIPGITPDSRLSFMTFKHLGESDELGCQEPPAILTSTSRSASRDDFHALVGHIDILGVTTALDGETLSVTFPTQGYSEDADLRQNGGCRRMPWSTAGRC